MISSNGHAEQMFCDEKKGYCVIELLSFEFVCIPGDYWCDWSSTIVLQRNRCKETYV